MYKLQVWEQGSWVTVREIIAASRRRARKTVHAEEIAERHWRLRQ